MSPRWPYGPECSPLFWGVTVGVYATAVYLTASGLDLGWIIESQGVLPPPAYILIAEYFCTLFLAFFLLVGLLLHNRKYLLVWIVFMMALFFPECGLVMYMSLYHWGLSTHRGFAEFVFYVCRAALNILSIVCIHWLQTTWRNEANILRRIQALHVGSVFSEVDSCASKSETEAGSFHVSHEIFYSSRRQESELLYVSTASEPSVNQKCFWNNSAIPHESPAPCPRQHMPATSTFCPKPGSSEFDASSFNEFLTWKLSNKKHPHQHLGLSSPSDVLRLSKGRCMSETSSLYNLAFSDSHSTYSTPSLERQAKNKHGNLRRSHSLDNILMTRPEAHKLRMPPELFGFSSERCEKFGFEDEDSSSTHSIRDIAL